MLTIALGEVLLGDRVCLWWREGHWGLWLELSGHDECAEKRYLEAKVKGVYGEEVMLHTSEVATLVNPGVAGDDPIRYRLR